MSVILFVCAYWGRGGSFAVDEAGIICSADLGLGIAAYVWSNDTIVDNFDCVFSTMLMTHISYTALTDFPP